MTKKLEALRGHNVSELEDQMVELKTELAKEKSLSVSGKKSEKPSKMRNLRRTIAQVLTIIGEKNKANKIQKNVRKK